MKYFSFLVLAAAFCAMGLSSDSQVSKSSETVRIAILKDIKELTLTVKGRYEIRDAANTVLSQGNSLREENVFCKDEGLVIGKESFSSARLNIISQKDGALYVNNRRFRGAIGINCYPDRSLSAVNSVDLESYIKGVMYHEVSHHWPMESLKVQAVCARTYVLYQKQFNQSKDYDVTNDIYSQVYGGKASERYRTNIAVERTEKLILAYQGSILPAYYHATCAGRTEDAGELWKQDLPPLKGVECNFCVRSPHYNWKKNLRLPGNPEKHN